MKVTSPAFKNEDFIPQEYTCDGKDVSPPLEWEAVPNAKSYAVIVEDPDAPGGTFIHWVIYNIPSVSLPKDVKKTLKTDYGVQGVNDFGRVGYGGPCPPRTHPPHRYYFRVYALDTVLPVKEGVTADDLREMMEGHVLDEGYIMGKYKRK